MRRKSRRRLAYRRRLRNEQQKRQRKLELQRTRRMLVIENWHEKGRPYRAICRGASAVLKNDPRVATIVVRRNMFSFSTHMIVAEVGRKKIYVGRFKVDIHRKASRLWIACLESGKIDGSDPFYVYPEWKEIGFCFGDGSRKSFLLKLIEEGEVLAAAFLILDSLAHINPSDEERALKVYTNVRVGQREEVYLWLFSQRL